MPKESKLMLYKCYYVPIVTYGSETWTLTNKDTSRANVFMSSVKKQQDRI